MSRKNAFSIYLIKTHMFWSMPPPTGSPRPLPRASREIPGPLKHHVVHPMVRLLPHEAELGRLLEHGVLEWEFDVLRLSELSGGHP